MSLVYDNISAIATAAAAAALAWLFGGAFGAAMFPVTPWICVVLLEVAVCFPQRHPSETSYEARVRAWKAMRRDPFVWMSVALILLLAIPFVNNGLCVNCDWREISQGANPEPPARHLPFCVDRLDHLRVFLWFLPACIAAVAARHSLTRSGKLAMLEMLVWNGVALTAVGVAQSVTGAQGPLWVADEDSSYFFSTFGYANTGGDYFTSLFLIAVALWRHRVEELRETTRAKKESRLARHSRFWRRNYLLIPAVILYFAALNTLSRASIILATTAAAIMFLHTAACFLARMKKAKRVRAGAYAGLSLALLFVAANFFMPQGVKKEVKTIDADDVAERVSGRGSALLESAKTLWHDHLLFGCGGWGYKHLGIQKLTKWQYKHRQTQGGINVHNDYLQFLAEHGIAGFGLMVAMVVVLLAPLARTWRRLAKAARFEKGGSRLPPPQSLFALPGSAFAILLSLAATLVHAFGDCPFRCASVVTLFFLQLASLEGFLPRLPHEEGKDRKN